MNHFVNIIYVKTKWFFYFSFSLFFCGKIFSQNFLCENGVANAKLEFPFLELSASYKKDDFNFGASLFSDKFWKNFPCSVKVGTLSYSSPLKNPSLSTASAFSSVKKKATGFSARIPGYSNFPDGISYFAQLGFSFPKRNLKSANVNFFYNQKTKFLVFASFFEFLLLKKVNFSYSFVFNSFCFEDLTFSSWYNEKSVFFHQDRLLCFSNQFVLSTKKFTTASSIFFYESPFKKIQFVCKTENQLKLNHFAFTFYAFYNPNKNLFTSSQTFIDEILQIKSGIQYNFMLRTKIPVFIKNGICGILNYDFSTQNHNLKIAFGNQFNMLNSTLYFLGTYSAKIENSYSNYDFSFTKFSFSVKNSWNFEKISFLVGGTYNFSPNSEGLTFEQNYNANIYFGKKEKVFCTNGFSISHKNGDFSSFSYSLGVGVKLKIKFLSVSGKISCKF